MTDNLIDAVDQFNASLNQKSSSDITTTNDPTQSNFVEPTLDEQLAEYDNQEAAINEIFLRTRLKLDKDDPVVQLLLLYQANNNTMRRLFDEAADNQLTFINKRLEVFVDEEITRLSNQQQEIIHAYDDGLSELKDTLEKMESQKEAIVADVWRKMQDRVTKQIEDQLSKDLQKMANNANNKVNNQRNILLGGLGGIILGILISTFTLFFLKN